MEVFQSVWLSCPPPSAVNRLYIKRLLFSNTFDITVIYNAGVQYLFKVQVTIATVLLLDVA